MSSTTTDTTTPPQTPWVLYGTLFGLLGAASIIAWGPIGVSGTYPRLIGEFARILDPEYAANNPYLTKMGSLFRGETFLVVGLLIGGLLGARRDTVKAPKMENPRNITSLTEVRDP